MTPAALPVPDAIADLLPTAGPTFVYDLAGLDAHAGQVRSALPGVEIHYAVKANPDAEVLRALLPHVDGYEVGSAGEFDHVRSIAPEAPISFGGPGKSDADLSRAVDAFRLNVESLTELERILTLAANRHRPVDVLLRRNLAIPVGGAALTMDGPFGMDDADADRAAALVTSDRARAAGVRYRGIHTHLASGLDADALLGIADRILALGDDEVCLGGGMAVSYQDPSSRFDWTRYGAGLHALNAARGAAVIRIEPGRALTVYSGWYITRVLDVKTVRGRRYAVVAGGTHHLRTPATKGHNQPCVVVPTGSGRRDDPAPVTIVGQLCTPKDVLTRSAAGPVAVGDTVVFGLAGAYGWNISHHDFLMHPHPEVVYVR